MEQQEIFIQSTPDGTMHRFIWIFDGQHEIDLQTASYRILSR